MMLSTEMRHIDSNSYEKFIILKRSRSIFPDVCLVDCYYYHTGFRPTPISISLDWTLFGNSWHYFYFPVIFLFPKKAQGYSQWKAKIVAQFAYRFYMAWLINDFSPCGYPF